MLADIPDDADPWTHCSAFERARIARRCDRRHRRARAISSTPRSAAARREIATKITQTTLRAVVEGTMAGDEFLRLTIAATALRSAVNAAEKPFGAPSLRRKALAACHDARNALLGLPVAVRNCVVSADSNDVDAEFAMTAARGFQACRKAHLGVELSADVGVEDALRDVMLLVHMFGAARASTSAFAAAAALEELKEFVRSHTPAEAETQIATIANSIETFVDGVDRLSAGADASTKDKALALVRLVLSEKVPMAALIRPLQDSLALRELVDDGYDAGDRGVRAVLARGKCAHDVVAIMRDAREGQSVLPGDEMLPIASGGDDKTPEGELHDARRMADIFLEVTLLLDSAGAPPDHTAGANVRDCFLLLLVLYTTPIKAHRFKITRDRKTNAVVAVNKKVFETGDAPWAEHYDRVCLPDNSTWYERVREIKAAGGKWTDPDFPPNASSLGPSAAAAAAGWPGLRLSCDVCAVRWGRLSERFQHSKWIQLSFVDVDSRLGGNAGKCFGADPNLVDAAPESQSELEADPSGGVDRALLVEAIATTIPERAATIVRGAMQGEPLAAHCGDAAVAAYLQENIPSIIGREGLRYSGSGRVVVRFDGSQELGQPRLTAMVELKFDSHVHMFSGEEHGVISPGDVNQGQLGDCYLLCGLSVISTHSQLLFDIFPDVPLDADGADAAVSAAAPDAVAYVEQSFNDQGVYAVRFWRAGAWRIVLVDDWMPEGPDGELLFARPPGKHAEVWCLIAEKAYAKLNGGYANIVGGTTELAIEDMCQAVPFVHDVGVGAKLSGAFATSDATGADACREALWAYLYRLRHSEISLLGVSWQAQPGEARATGDRAQKMGTFGNHAYGIVSMHEDVAGSRLVRLRNPHGHGGEWTGAWCDTDPRWQTLDAEAKANSGWTDAGDGAVDDGMFYMSFEDFFAHWNALSVARLLGDEHSNPYIAQLNPGWSEWTIAGEIFSDAAASDSSISDKCRHADQFQVVIAKACELVVCVSVHTHRVQGDHAYYRTLGGTVLPIIYKDRLGKPIREGRRADGLYKGSALGASTFAAKPVRTLAVAHDVEPGCYNIVPLMGKYRGRYHLRVFTCGAGARVIPLGSAMSMEEAQRREEKKERRKTRRASRIAMGLPPRPKPPLPARTSKAGDSAALPVHDDSSEGVVDDDSDSDEEDSEFTAEDDAH